MQIDESDGHLRNAKELTYESVECNANVTCERHGQPEKHARPRTVTEPGITIDESNGQSENARRPIRATLECRSKVTLQTVAQDRKGHSDKAQITFGMMTLDSPSKERQHTDPRRANKKL
jgi:hypothetical protein